MTKEENDLIETLIEWHKTNKRDRVQKRNIDYLLHRKTEHYLETSAEKFAKKIEKFTNRLSKALVNKRRHR